MQVKVKKEGKQETYNLINSWADVTLEKWLQIIDIKGESKTKEAEETIAALTDMPKQLIKELSIKDVAVIMGKVAEMQANENSSLKRIVEIEGVEYGFHPDLDEITLGEYADLETMIKNGVEGNMPELMSILYRPVTEKGDNGVYTIAAYDGKISIRAEEMKKMSAEQVESALRFFFAFVTELLKILPSYLMEQMQEMKMQLHPNPLEKSGDGLESSIGYATKT